jgi:hypothetical protein
MLTLSVAARRFLLLALLMVSADGQNEASTLGYIQGY